MREISLYLLLGHLLIAGVGAGSTCLPMVCLNCNATGAAQADPCANCSTNPASCITKASAIPKNCKKAFQVSIKSNKSKVEEGEDIDLSCTHNLPNLTLKFGWERNGKTVKDGINKTELSLKKVLSNKAGKYTCFVSSRCGKYESSPHDVTVNNNTVVLLVICGVSALALVVILGLAIKFKLKRDNTKHRDRARQKAKDEQSRVPAPFTPRES
ncbi:uncharacterized protein LOC126389231 [Epinephelus moara]|uniref:uncharacterized protein LOC126389231 n=1 Tax=Epinephelus moara TaxID=300413 RepID=UPI00214ED694|nr:uncharacterized protein LOC126389231 [Epinephelus moara]